MSMKAINDNSAWEERQAYVARGYAISKQKKRELGFFAGLQFFGKSDYTLMIVSRHWPHLIPWSWFLAWHAYRGDERRRWFRLSRKWNKLGWRMDLLRLGHLDLHRQNDDWMVKGGLR
jgi:hypothetical protein